MQRASTHNIALFLDSAVRNPHLRRHKVSLVLSAGVFSDRDVDCGVPTNFLGLLGQVELTRMAHSGKVKTITAKGSASTNTVVVAANGDEEGAALAYPDSEAPPARGLSRKESMKDAANKAVEHYKEHKWKYIACKVVVGLAIGLGVGLGIAVAVLKRQGGSLLSLSAKKAASTGTSLPVVSPFPSKGDKSRRRMLVVEQQQLRRLDTAVGVASLPAACDYNVHTPEYVVNDKSTDSVKFINMVSCLTDQLRISDVAINTTMNPSRLPYIAMVDGTKVRLIRIALLLLIISSPRLTLLFSSLLFTTPPHPAPLHSTPVRHGWAFYDVDCRDY